MIAPQLVLSTHHRAPKTLLDIRHEAEHQFVGHQPFHQSAPDATFPKEGRHLPASGTSASSTAPVLRKPVSNIEPWIPSSILPPSAPAAIPPIIAAARGCCQNGVVQTGTRLRRAHRPQLRPTFFYEHRCRLFCKT